MHSKQCPVGAIQKERSKRSEQLLKTLFLAIKQNGIVKASSLFLDHALNFRKSFQKLQPEFESIIVPISADIIKIIQSDDIKI